MGERRNGACRVDLDRELRVEFHGVKVTSDAGLLAYRELDDVFGLTEMAGSQLCDPRTGKNTQHRVTERTGLRELILDLDSSDSPTHGRQEGAAYNGHFGYTCYHPLFCFNQLGGPAGGDVAARKRAQCG